MSAEGKRHMMRVSGLGCCVCGGAAIAHHIRSGTSSGMGRKARDFETIPLCNFHHTDGGYGNAIHAGALFWQHKYGFESELLQQVNRELGIA